MKNLIQYDAMRTAIARCDRIDECKDIVDKSVAMAAYYAQIKDFKTELAFNRVRMRAWRRIAELLAVIDTSDCETQTAKAKKIRAAFIGDPVVDAFSDSRIYELVRLNQIPDAEFEHAINQTISGSIGDLMRRTPTAERQMASSFKMKQPTPEEKAAAKKRLTKLDQINRHTQDLWDSSTEAMKEVGITLERKDRLNMKQVVFLIKDEIHAVMRQAAFDKHITMQDVLRRGLKLWLEANGYEYPDDNDRIVAKQFPTKEKRYGLE